MKVALGADHGGFALKSQISQFLTQEGYKVVDYGTKSAAPCDYPIYAYRVAKAVSRHKADLGVLICKSGNGMAMVANKLPNVRAAICFDKDVAALSRQHNNANILVLGSEHLFDEPELIIRTWLESSFEGGRHQRRVNEISRVEEKVGLVHKKKQPDSKRKTKRGK